MTQDFFKHRTGADSSAESAFVVVYDTVFTSLPRALWVGTAGNLDVVMADGTEIRFTGVLGGTLLPIRVSKVKSSSTVGSLVGLY